MNTASQSASEHQAAPAQAGSQETHGASAKQGVKKKPRALALFLGIDIWKRQGSILMHRASFPLLRQVIKRERSLSEQRIQLSEIPSDILQRSLLAHLFILVFTVPATFWAAYIMTKGLSAGIRFDVWFNGWLLQGVPVFIFCTMKSLTSNHSRKLIRNELALRAMTVADAPSKGE